MKLYSIRIRKYLIEITSFSYIYCVLFITAKENSEISILIIGAEMHTEIVAVNDFSMKENLFRLILT